MCMRVCVYICACICVYVSVSMCVYICIHVCVHIPLKPIPFSKVLFLTNDILGNANHPTFISGVTSLHTSNIW